jgi:hypothetical protein
VSLSGTRLYRGAGKASPSPLPCRSDAYQNYCSRCDQVSLLRVSEQTPIGPIQQTQRQLVREDHERSAVAADRRLARFRRGLSVIETSAANVCTPGIANERHFGRAWWQVQWGRVYLQPCRSTLSFALASAIVCHCILLGSSAPPHASGLERLLRSRTPFGLPLESRNTAVGPELRTAACGLATSSLTLEVCGCTSDNGTVLLRITANVGDYSLVILSSQ